MKKVVLVILLLLSARLSFGLEQPEKVLTLQESIKWALTNNQDLLFLLEKEYIAEQKIKEADSYFFPQVSISGAYTRLNVSTPTTLPPALGGSSLAVGVTNHYAMRTSLTQYLFTGGYLVNQRSIAEADLEIVNREYRETKRQIIMKVAERFYDLVYLQQMLELYCEDQEILQRYADSAAGNCAVRKYELCLIELEKANVENTISLTEDELALAEMEFNKAVGFELSSEIKVVGDFKVSSTDEEKRNVQTYVAQAIERAPKVELLSFTEKQIRHRIEQAFSERYPTIVLGADYERSGLNADLKGSNRTATVAVHLPIFNGWRSWARVRQLRGELKQTNLLQVKVADELKMEVQKTYIRNRRSGKNIELLVKAKEQAQKALESAEKCFRQNQISGAEVLVVLQKYREARMNELKNSYTYTVSDIKLKVLTAADPLSDNL